MTHSCSTQYIELLNKTTSHFDWSQLDDVTTKLFSLWKEQKSVFICGNGGSAANADHIANDLSYGVNPKGRAFKVESLPANSAVISCLANDTGYENIFAQQLINKAQPGDILIVLSGSGNSSNIISALEQAQKMKVYSIAILGYDGGNAKNMADYSLHFPVMDMQLAEDLQLIVGHMIMKNLKSLIDNS